LATINVSALAASTPSLSASASLRQVVPRRLSSFSQPAAFAQRARSAASRPSALKWLAVEGIEHRFHDFRAFLQVSQFLMP